jgi:hypothetical protein
VPSWWNLQGKKSLFKHMHDMHNTIKLSSYDRSGHAIRFSYAQPTRTRANKHSRMHTHRPNICTRDIPSRHGIWVGDVDPFPQAYPPEHMPYVDCPVLLEKNPAGTVRHTVAPETGAYDPAAQFAHEDCKPTVLNRPAAHRVGTPTPSTQKAPGGQGIMVLLTEPAGQ